jgi:UDP-N-acetylmuramate-alanine ligase
MTVVEAVRESGHKNVKFFEDRAALVEYLKGRLDAKTVLVTMGAGDVWKIGTDLVQKHRA